LLPKEKIFILIGWSESKLANFNLGPSGRGLRKQPRKQKPTRETPVQNLKIHILVMWYSEGTERFYARFFPLGHYN